MSIILIPACDVCSCACARVCCTVAFLSVHFSFRLFIWKGAMAPASLSRDLARAISILSRSGLQAVELEEGRETEDFWEALGPKQEYKSVSGFYTLYPSPAKLFCCSTKAGSYDVEEVRNYTQAHLTLDEVLFLVSPHFRGFLVLIVIFRTFSYIS